MSNHHKQAPIANPPSTSLTLRIIYLGALASVAFPMPLTAWAGLSIGSVSSWIFLVPMLLLLLIAVWRAVGVLRDPHRLDAPAVDGVLKWRRNLAIGLNNDGRIERGAELFGSETPLANGQAASNGSAALDELDQNRDGWVDAAEPRFAQPRVWRDSTDVRFQTSYGNSRASDAIAALITH
jgi:hypothetical protein